MIAFLRVKNFAVVQQAEIEFISGLNVLTGETGAGKSILIDALSLLLDKRFSPHSLRLKEDKLVVEAVFSKNEEEIVLRREIDASSKAKSLCFMNGMAVTFAQLQETAQGLLTIYGQNEHVYLLHPGNQRFFLDDYAGNHDTLSRLAKLVEDIKKKKSELAALEQAQQQANERLDYLHFQISEFDELNIVEGEDVILEQKLKILSHAEELMSKSRQIIDAFYQHDQSIYNIIASNQKDLAFLQKILPEFKSFADELDRFYHFIPEMATFLSNQMAGTEYSEEELNQLESRIMKLNRLKTKYKMDLAGLLKKRRELCGERDYFLNLKFSIQDKRDELAALLDEYRKVNLLIRSKRQDKGKALSRTVEQELKKLEMKMARFVVNTVEVEPDEDNISDRGTDKVEFYFSSNPDQPPGPLKEVASGGELSRLMLVLKSLINDDEDMTYIFDEIDSGIGGKTAEFVGEKLRRIARNHQVICISHLPQIASFAAKHFLVSKEYRNNKTYSSTKALTYAEQVEEIARLMAGSAINDDVKKAAASLLQKNQL